jgi:hypothetical protein
VTAADKAHNARDLVHDARRDTQSRSTTLLGDAVQVILASDAYRRVVPQGIAPAVWAAGYLERVEGHDG